MHWFDYKGLVILLLIELLAEVVHLLGQDPGLREEVVLTRENFGHAHQIPREVILAGQLIHPWVMVNALMRLKLGKLFRGSTAHITPVNVPITIFIF